jgi:hypothetical protein
LSAAAATGVRFRRRVLLAMTPARSGESPQAAEMPECIRGRRWADVGDEADAEEAAEAARAEAIARCSPQGMATLGD